MMSRKHPARPLFPGSAISIATAGAAFVAALTLGPAAASADQCGPASGDVVSLGDTDYAPRWACRQDFINFFWDGYDFDQGDWDDGFGYDAPCDINQPLARTFNGLYALHYSAVNPPTRTNDFSGSMLRWGGNYARQHLDELDGRCANGNALATTWSGPIIDNKTELYMLFFNIPVVDRAGTIFHESRHADGWPHNASDSSCGQGGSCDSRWSYLGANRYEVSWFWDFYVNAYNVTPAMRARARDIGNARLLYAFATFPGFLIP